MASLPTNLWMYAHTCVGCGIHFAENYPPSPNVGSICARCGQQTALHQQFYQQQASQLGGLYGQHWNTSQTASGGPIGLPYTGPGAGTMSQSGTAHYPGLGYASPEPRPIESAGIRAGEIIAWRFWTVNWVDEELMSMAVPCAWKPGEVMKVTTAVQQNKLYGEARVLDSDGCNGVHAFKEIAYAEREYTWSTGMVCGTVALWGEVIEHQEGFRAEFGRVNSLDYLHKTLVPFENKRWLKKLREKYGVEDKRATQFKLGV